MHKILFVIDNLEFGGGEKGFLQLIKGLHKRYNICVAAHPGGLFCEELEKIGVRLYPLAMEPQFSLKRLKALRIIIARERFDIVHGQGSRAEFYARIAGFLARRRHYVSTIQAPVDKFEVGILKKKVYILLDLFTERFVDSFIVVSDELRRMLIEKHGLGSNKVIKIPNGIELDKICPNKAYSGVEKTLGISQGDFVVGAVGRLVWAKGFPYLIDAFRTVKKTLPKAKLIIAGEGPMKGALINRVKQAGLTESVKFLGFIKDIPSLMTGFDVLVIPSLSEGFPMITLEGMAMAKPIVATGLPGILEQIENGRTGIIVPLRDSAPLGGAIIDLLMNKDKARRLGQGARRYVVENFSVEKMIAKTEQVYQALLGR